MPSYGVNFPNPFAPSRRYESMAGRHRQRMRRAEILAGARRILAASNDHSITLQMLAKGCNTSPQYIFSSIGTKREVISAAFAEYHSDLLEYSVVGGIAQNLMSFFGNVTALAEVFPSYLLVVSQIYIKSPQLLAGSHAQTVEAVYAIEPIGPEVVQDHVLLSDRALVRQLVWMCTGAVFDWSAGTCSTADLQARAVKASSIFIDGLHVAGSGNAS